MKYNWSKENLENTVNKANCWFDWLRALGVPTRGRNYETLKSKAAIYGIDTSHFNYQYARTHNGKRIIDNRANEEIFSENIPIKTETVKRAYIKRILENTPRCECCGVQNWNNKELVFQLHHKDGNPKNNKLSNLILLCPNCHSQTENFCMRGRGKGRKVYTCPECGKIVTRGEHLCKECSAKNRSRMPEIATLKSLIELKSNEEIGRLYGVTGSAVHKWRKRNNL